MRNKRGVISVFLLFIIVVLITFVGVITDVARIKILENDLNQIVDISADSGFTQYMQEIKNQYGLLATDEFIFKETFIENFEKNILEKQRKGFLNLYDIKVEKINITPIYSLADNKILENQMYKYMRYRGPVSIAKFLNSLNKIEEYKEDSKIAKERLVLDKKMSVVISDINLMCSIIKENEEHIESIAKIVSKNQNIKNKESIDEILTVLDKSKENNIAISKCITKLKRNIPKVEKDIEETIEKIEKIKSNSKFKGNTLESINKMKKELYQYISTDMKRTANENGELINSIIKHAKRLGNEIGNEAEVEKIKKDIAKYVNYKLDIANVDKRYVQYDNRSKNIIDISMFNSKVKNTEIPKNVYDRLPSEKNTLATYMKKMTFLDNKDDKLEKTFSILDGISFENINKILKKVYVNEYILQVFSNRMNYTQKMLEKDSYLECEVEYVLQGNRKQKENIESVNNKLFMTRLMFNIFHVYSSPQKRLLAFNIAAAVSSWWSGGISIPIVQNMIMCSWAASESSSDVNTLLAGREIPLIKTEGNWKTFIPGLKKVKLDNKKDSNIYMNYEDYLRLFLLMMDDKSKIDRVKDLMQLNMNQFDDMYKIEDSKTYYKVNIDISINYIFMTKSFIPSKYKKEGRHVIKIARWIGY